MPQRNLAVELLQKLLKGELGMDDPGQYLRAREGECELGTLAIGKRCQERISATGWAGSGQLAEYALDTLYVARNRGRIDIVAFWYRSAGYPVPWEQIKSKSSGSFFFRRNQFGFLSGAAMGATKQNEQPMTA
jgi:hypothetical protein